MMTWGVLNAAMLLGLLGAAVPVVIHLLNRRRDPVDRLGGDAVPRPRPQGPAEAPADRAAADARADGPAGRWSPWPWPGRSGAGGGRRRPRRPGRGGAARRATSCSCSTAPPSMGRRGGGTTPRALAVRLGAAVRRAAAAGRLGRRPRRRRTGSGRWSTRRASTWRRSTPRSTAWRIAGRGAGSSDLPAALAEAFRVLERTGNPARDVVVLTDGQRSPGGRASRAAGPWSATSGAGCRSRPGSGRSPSGAGRPPDAPNGSVGPLDGLAGAGHAGPADRRSRPTSTTPAPAR